MKIHIIVANQDEIATPWVVGAWDELSIDDNYEGWNYAIKKAKKDCPNSDIRTAIIKIPDDFLEKIYNPPVVEGEV